MEGDDPSNLLSSTQVGLAAEATASTRSLQRDQYVSSTQPQADTFLRKVRKASRLFTFENRPRRTVEQYNVLTKSLPDSSQSDLRAQVFDLVKLRLKEVGVNIQDLDEQFFSWMLPKNLASVADWNELINKPYLVSNRRLQTMINMRSSTSAETRHPTGTTMFYVRTFAFTLTQLIDVLQDAFGSEGEFSTHAQRLFAAIRHLDPVADAQTTLYVRYCGMTRSSPWDRHINDLKSTETCFKTGVLQSCQRLYPAVIAAAEVHELYDGAIHITLERARQRIADVREQALIALFDLDTLLNSAVGGDEVRLSTFADDDNEFLRFKTNTFNQMDWYASPAADTSAIQKYAVAVQQYAMDHPSTTGHCNNPIDDEVASMIATQAIPSVLVSQPYTVMVSIGSDLTAEAVRNRSSFYRGGIAASELAMRVWDNLAHLELGYHSTAARPVLDLQSRGHLPFVDLYPWTTKSDKDLLPALALLRSYLQNTKPLIVLTFSRLVKLPSKPTPGSANNFRSHKQLLETFNTSMVFGKTNFSTESVPLFSPSSMKSLQIIPMTMSALSFLLITQVQLAMSLEQSITLELEFSARLLRLSGWPWIVLSPLANLVGSANDRYARPLLPRSAL